MWASGVSPALAKAQLLHADRIARAPVENRHFMDGLRFGLERAPGADSLDEVFRALGERDRAQLTVPRLRPRIDDDQS